MVVRAQALANYTAAQTQCWFWESKSVSPCSQSISQCSGQCGGAATKVGRRGQHSASGLM